jgi:FAD/FMN-containing dehydrogenase
MELANARSQAETDEQLTEFLGDCLEDELVSDGIIASSDSQRNDLWRMRHSISEAEKEAGGSIKQDISVPVSRMPEFLAEAEILMDKLLPGVRPIVFGHLGDGNLHYNLSQPEGMDAQEFLDMWQDFNDVVHGLAVEKGGSFSAEHGIGSLKVDELARLGSTVGMSLMRSIKQALDPKGIMNPGKVLKLNDAYLPGGSKTPGR